MDIEKLKAVIAEVPPGDLRQARDAQGICGLMHPEKEGVAVAWLSSCHQPINGYVDEEDCPPGRPNREAYARFFLAFNPSTASELIAEIERLRAAVGGGAPAWKPIETAPRHTEVMVWREDSGPFIAKLTTPDAVMTDDELERMGADTFPGDYEEWYSDAYGWQEGSERPTYWQPLPAAPAPSDPATGGTVEQPIDLQRPLRPKDMTEAKRMIVQLQGRLEELKAQQTGEAVIDSDSFPPQETTPVTIEEAVRRANATLTSFEVVTEKPKTTFPPDWEE